MASIKNALADLSLFMDRVFPAPIAEFFEFDFSFQALFFPGIIINPFAGGAAEPD